MEHEHTWALTIGPGGCAASCRCGLAVVAADREGGGTTWRVAAGRSLVAAPTAVAAARAALLAFYAAGGHGRRN